tara:strand:- start:2842 stop:3051 length:210 start_codon:yes stop_codon:yes gene_type:complete
LISEQLKITKYFEDFMATPQEMLQSLNNNDVNAFKDQVEADLQDRIRQQIDLKKIEVAKNLVTGETEEN